MQLHPALRKTWPWLASTLSGVLLVLCFAPWECPQFVWIALLPLLAALWNPTPAAPRWRAPLLGYAAGVVFFSGTFYWLHSLAGLFESPALLGLPLLLGAYLGLYTAAWAWLVCTPPEPARSAAGTSLRNIGFAVRGACAWVALDWVRGWLFTGFGWNSPGIALHNNLALIQIADLFGVHGITFLVVFANLILALLARRLKHEASIRTLPNLRGEIMTLLVMIGCSVSYGVRIVVQKPASTMIPLRVLALQTNIPQEEKFNADQEDAVLRKIDNLMQVAGAMQPPPDLVVWPEAATPRGMFADEANHQFTIRQAERANAPLLLGSLEPVTVEGSAELQDFNSAILLQKGGIPVQSYRKRHIVPFGEFLPFRDWLPEWVRQLVPGDLTPGKVANLLFLEKPAIRIGALVCFEDSLARETRDLALEGAQVLANLTNDSWFGTTAGAAQHLANAKFRAVETRLPLVRCANTGVTCSVDSMGRVEQHLAPFTEGVDTLSIAAPQTPVPTLYTRWGDFFVLVSSGPALMLALAKRRRKEPPSPVP